MIARAPALAIVVAAVLALALSACGRKGDLEQPEGAKPTYPRTYPSR